MPITTFYRGEVQIPQHLYEAHGHTKAYDMRSLAISSESTVATSGQDAYAEVYEWAEDSSRAAVELWEKFWMEYIAEMEREVTQ